MPHAPDRKALFWLVAIQVAATLVVRPRGEFPVNDDWAYTHSVQWLLSEHRVRLSDWIAMNLLPQTLLGGAVAKLFGFSFETLRHVTQVAALLASAGAYAWFRACRFEPAAAFVATLAILAFPAWPQLANSYMSDLYALVFALPAAALFLRSLDQPARARLIAASLLAAVGVLQRQVVLVVPFAFAVAWIWSHRPWTARTLAIGLAPFAVSLGAQLAYQAYLAAGPGIPEAQQYLHGRVVPLLIRIILGEDGYRAYAGWNMAAIAGYLGLFVAGWFAFWGMGGATLRTRVLVLAGGAVIALLALAHDWLPPYLEWQLVDAAGIGPYTVYDGVGRNIDGMDRTPGVLWRVAGVGAAFGLAALVALAIATLGHIVRRGRDSDRERIFLAAYLVGYLGPFAVTGFIERYLLYTLPFLFALWARTWTREGGPALRVAALA